MSARGRLKLRQTKEGLVEKLTKVVRDAAGEVLSALEESPSHSSPPTPSRAASDSGGTCPYYSSRGCNVNQAKPHNLVQCRAWQYGNNLPTSRLS